MSLWLPFVFIVKRVEGWGGLGTTYFENTSVVLNISQVFQKSIMFTFSFDRFLVWVHL